MGDLYEDLPQQEDMREDEGPRAQTATSQRQMWPRKPDDARDRAQSENLGALIHESDRTRPGYPSRVPRVVPPSGVPLYNP